MVLNAELEAYLNGKAAGGRKNHRRGYSSKTTSKLDIWIPPDREGPFDQKPIARRQRRLQVDEKIVSIYPRGIATREIQGLL